MLNVGCGSVFVCSDDWCNLDYSPRSAAVRKWDLLDKLPFKEESVELVYSSHFVEHVPRQLVPDLLRDYYRVLKPGGSIRLVLPDLENMAKEYLHKRSTGEHDKADLVVLELIDQSVRKRPGGYLGEVLRDIRHDPHLQSSLGHYVFHRLGEKVDEEIEMKKMGFSVFFQRLLYKIRFFWIRSVCTLLPKAFCRQNVSFAEIGELHQWLWDFHQMKTELEKAGFVNVQQMSARTSRIKDFPFYPLDLHKNGAPRKGSCSMYVEAEKKTSL
ncbi:MAG: methyltransferase domain-containing protein [Bdellovibrionaceae bacterium]|nr:methyltransferase domain-containing protein [Pseudobdellovibrionaceae bacterium]